MAELQWEILFLDKTESGFFVELVGTGGVSWSVQKDGFEVPFHSELE